MGRNGVKVVIRTRPTASFAQNHIIIDQDDNTIMINAVGHHENPMEGPSNRKESWKFRYHQVLHNAGQDTAYDAIARDIVHASVITGINGTILAYGQTGAGKTFTMIGDTRNYQYRGIAPRAIAQVFSEATERIETTYTFHISYMEIYNDRIFDLLSENNEAKGDKQQEFVIAEDAKGTLVKGLTQVPVASEKEALDQLFNGELIRTVAEHSLNTRSNRSHCIFTIHISQTSRAGGSERVLHSKLHLVDLAGSERLKKTMAETGDKKSDSVIQKESMYINQSLSFLEQCILALGAKEARHIPYRQTKLTNVLKDSLGGNSNTLMFACIWGESKHLEETISTLKLAQRMMKVQNETSTIVETDPVLLLKKYERTIKDLKQELNMHDALVERTGVLYDEFTPEQIHECTGMVRRYVDAEAPEEDGILELNTVQQIRQLFRQFKLLIRNAESGNGAVARAISRQGTVKADADVGRKTPSGFEDNATVGAADTSRGFGLGLGADAARPTSVDQSLYPQKADGKDDHPDATSPHRDTKGVKDNNMNNDIKQISSSPEKRNEEKNEAFRYFTLNIATRENEDLQKVKAKLKAVKENYKSVTSNMNGKKRSIDTLKMQLSEKASSRVVNEAERVQEGIDEDIIDEEEFILMKEERDAKREYRTLHETLKGITPEMNILMKRVDVLKERLVDDFETWFKKGGITQHDDGGDKLDDGEKFDQMEIDRVFSEDPESLAFFQAQKKMRQVAHNTSPSHNGRRKK